MFRIHASNQLEKLVERLGNRISGCGNWHQKELVLVQSAGMERWINLQLADLNGISANIEFPFPKSFLIKTLRENVGLPKQDPFDKEHIAWRIYRLLLELENQPDFSALKAYVADGDSLLKCFQLSEKLADLFDQYLVFRPSTILSWSDPMDQRLFFDQKITMSADLKWQRLLWQCICQEIDEFPYVKMLQKFCQQEISPESKAKLPSRISLFGISNLPPILVNFFEKLGTVIDVDFYYLSPCEAFWSDIVSEKRVASLELKGEDEYLEVGNPLLSSMGRLGRDFSLVIQNMYESEIDEDYQSGTSSSLLAEIQNDILKLVNPKESSEKRPYSNDDSLEFVSCHSPLREVEVLYDHLLKTLKAHQSLEPRDILVMAPDIQIYAPYITAVFDTPESDNLKLPYSISDRDQLQESLVSTAFMTLLKLPTLRLTSVEVLELFNIQPIYSSFGVTQDQLETIENWVRKTNIRWGIDGDFREACGVPRFEQNSWKVGIDRAMMGFAMADDDTVPDELPLPFDLEGVDAQVIGQFVEFCDQLFRFVKEAKSREQREVNDWSTFLQQTFSIFFKEDRDNSAELKKVKMALVGLNSQTDATDFHEKVNLPIITHILKNKLNKSSGANGFLQRGITFCKMLPMRSIPSKVVCILGLNDGLFPRQGQKLSFDLVARQPMLGDRSMKNDDRYLFLEALLSARQKLYLSFIGRSAKDNSPIPPSVLLGELVEYIAAAYDIEEEKLITEHPLQAFSPRYFSDESALFSFSNEAYEGALALTSTNQDSQRTMTEKLTSKLPTVIELDFTQILSFFKNPAQYFLKNQLNVDFRFWRNDELKTDEPFKIESGLEAYSIGNPLLMQLIKQGNKAKENYYHRLQIEGILPYGSQGQQVFEELAAKVEVQASYAREAGMVGDGEAKPFSIELNCEVDNTPVIARLSGTLLDIYGGQIIKSRYSDGNANDNISAWLNHLVGNAIAGLPDKTLLIIGKDDPKTKEFKPIYETEYNAKSILTVWINQFLEGQQKPLVFLPKSSMAYMEELRAQDNQEKAIEAAETKGWNPSYHDSGEQGDPANQYCFGPEFPGKTNQAEFCAMTEQLLTPMYDALGN